MQFDENLIRNVVAQVLSEVGPMPPGPSVTGLPAGSIPAGRYGIFYDADSAVTAARAAFEQLRERTMAERKQIIDVIRRISIDNCEELGLMEMAETKIGRPEHKIEKLKTLGMLSPGTEFLETKCYSGDDGLAVIERAPFG
ncbi:MAG: aldehyde dehydrogenase EutE, partial [Pirellulaceae bacterium]|nr:aldehyde dehydrogenase EutE [Pirellulaceae bacterium]